MSNVSLQIVSKLSLPVTLYRKVSILVHFLVNHLDEYYLVLWEEENSVSVVSESNVAKGGGAAVGECCDVVWKRKCYLGRVAAKGTNNIVQVYLSMLAGYLSVRACCLIGLLSLLSGHYTCTVCVCCMQY